MYISHLYCDTLLTALSLLNRPCLARRNRNSHKTEKGLRVITAISQIPYTEECVPVETEANQGKAPEYIEAMKMSEVNGLGLRNKSVSM